MKLTKKGITNREEWIAAGISMPEYSIDKMISETAETPEWVHFGAGNIFRGFIGSLNQRLLNSGAAKTGIIAVETFDYDIIDMIYAKHDNLTLSVMMDADSNLDMEVLAGIAFGIKGNEYDRLRAIFEKKSLKMVSYTITEKGYSIHNLDGDYLSSVAADMKNGPRTPTHAMSLTAALLYHRFKHGAFPIAIVSMDNCSHNGEKLSAAVKEIAKAWADNNIVEKEFLDYLDSKVSFPWSMIDKITPRPSDMVKEKLSELGVENMDAVITSKNTYIAPFVNAETAQYLVIEDDFPNGRPPLENAGVYMTTRETVNKSETMKVTTCLNPLHTALAVFGCLLGYNAIWQEMRDRELVKLVKLIADEGIKVVTNPGIINPNTFSKEVIEKRLPNPNIPDMPQRIATDTSQKVGIRYGETIKAYMEAPYLNTNDLKAIPAAIAGWLRYLIGIDDSGNTFERSADPMLAELSDKLSGIQFDRPDSINSNLDEILSNKELFGIDLYKAGIAERVKEYFKMMLNGKDSVRKALKYIVN